jgi:putative zinc finger protein
MNAPGCERIGFAELIDYAAREAGETDAAAFEEHLFSCADCGARAAELDALVRAIGPAVRSGKVGGFVTDDVLNQLAREGIRVRTFVLSPGAVVPCAVWDDDELIAMRLRADLGGASEVTLSQRVAGTEVLRASGQVVPGSHGEVIYTLSASLVRQLEAVDIEVLLSAHEGGEERPVGSYTLLHGGSFHRR